jgi:radical SAM protein with 4Fe4S-binding SPASM domain
MINLEKINFNLGIKRKFSCLKKLLPLDFGPEEIRINPMIISCNHLCIMCWQRTISTAEKNSLLKKERRKLKLKNYNFLFSLLPGSVKTVDVTGGGEPLLHPEIFQILNLIKKNNFYGRLITNGLLLNSSNIKKLLDIDWDSIRISFHAACKNTYFKIHGRDDFNKIIKLLQIIKKNKQNYPQSNLKISLLFVIQKLNYKEIFKFSCLAERLAVDELEYDNLIDYKKGLTLNKKQMNIAKKLLIKVAKKCFIPNNSLSLVKSYKLLYEKGKNLKQPLSFDKNRFKNRRCGIIQKSVFVFTTGEVYPCCFLINKSKKMGNIRNEKLIDIWRKPVYKKLRKKLLIGKFEPECLEMCPYLLEEK